MSVGDSGGGNIKSSIIGHSDNGSGNDSSSSNSNGNKDAAAAAVVRTRTTSNIRRTRTIDVRKKNTGTVIVPVSYVSFLSGLGSGVLQAGIFNPVDRALYLSITNNTPFLCVENFRHPYRGFWQSIGGKALSGGLYFPLEQYFLKQFGKPGKFSAKGSNKNNIQKSNDPIRNLLAGIGAGSLNAILMNPLNTIRFKTWGRMGDIGSNDRGLIKEVTSMIKDHKNNTNNTKIRFHPLLKGLVPTLLRDVTFGTCYTFTRLQIQYSYDVDPTSKQQFLVNLWSAAMATILSSPLNFARNIQYATKSGEAQPTTRQILRKLLQEMNEHAAAATPQNSSSSMLFRKCHFLNRRLRIGWGTVRVSMGMAFGHWAYEQLHELFAA